MCQESVMTCAVKVKFKLVDGYFVVSHDYLLTNYREVTGYTNNSKCNI